MIHESTWMEIPMKIRFPILALGTLVALAFGVAAAADSLSVKPGMWRTTTVQTMEMPGMPAMPPMERTTEACLEDGEFDPSEAFGDPEGGCRVENVSTSGNTMSFDMVCPSPQGVVRGRASYESDGDTGKGEFEITIDMGETQGKMRMEMRSERLGSC